VGRLEQEHKAHTPAFNGDEGHHMADLPHYLTLRETAAVLRCTGPTVLKWADEGVIPAGVRVGSQWRFAEADIAGVLNPNGTD
jgi:excisionase family DNA binding protein